MEIELQQYELQNYHSFNKIMFSLYKRKYIVCQRRKITKDCTHTVHTPPIFTMHADVCSYPSLSGFQTVIHVEISRIF